MLQVTQEFFDRLTKTEELAASVPKLLDRIGRLEKLVGNLQVLCGLQTKILTCYDAETEDACEKAIKNWLHNNKVVNRRVSKIVTNYIENGDTRITVD